MNEIGTAKMLIADFYKVPIGEALGLVALILTTSVVASLIATRKDPRPEPTA